MLKKDIFSKLCKMNLRIKYYTRTNEFEHTHRKPYFENDGKLLNGQKKKGQIE